MTNPASTLDRRARNACRTVPYAVLLALALILCLGAKPALAESESETPPVSFYRYAGTTLNLGAGIAGGGEELFTAMSTSEEIEGARGGPAHG